VVFIKVQWVWLTWLVGEMVLGTVFLVWTMLATRRMGMHVLKSSPLATLLALDGECRNLADGQLLDDLQVGGWDEESALLALQVRLSGQKLVLAPIGDGDKGGGAG
jgi:hypothetical protein